jgi:hypothetical protein
VHTYRDVAIRYARTATRDTAKLAILCAAAESCRPVIGHHSHRLHREGVYTCILISQNLLIIVPHYCAQEFIELDAPAPERLPAAGK